MRVITVAILARFLFNSSMVASLTIIANLRSNKYVLMMGMSVVGTYIMY